MSPDELVAKHRGSGVLVDTNLLVLLAIGMYRRTRISNFNRTRQYTQEDFDLLVRLIDLFRKRVVTPHIFAEADNLTRQLPRAEHRAVAAVMAKIVAESFELYCPSNEAVAHKYYSTLGLTDCTIVAASQNALVITDDVRLSSILPSLCRDAININHIRTLNWS